MAPLEGRILVPLSGVRCFLVTTSFGFEALAIISSAVGCGAELLVKKYFRTHDFCERLSFA